MSYKSEGRREIGDLTHIYSCRKASEKLHENYNKGLVSVIMCPQFNKKESVESLAFHKRLGQFPPDNFKILKLFSLKLDLINLQIVRLAKNFKLFSILF